MKCCGFFEEYCLLQNYHLILASWIIFQYFSDKVAAPFIITSITISKYKDMKNQSAIDVVLLIVGKVIGISWRQQFFFFLAGLESEDLTIMPHKSILWIFNSFIIHFGCDHACLCCTDVTFPKYSRIMEDLLPMP